MGSESNISQREKSYSDPNFSRKILETGERPKLGADMWQVIAEVACPTLVVRGSRSDLFAAEFACHHYTLPRQAGGDTP
jgi:hypothetical protein